MRILNFWFGLLIGAVALAGCGGGGSDSGGVPPARTNRVSILATDSLRDDFDQVWATLYRVELVGAGGSAVTVFLDEAGKQMDLRALRDVSGPVYAYLGDAGVPEGTYTEFRVTLAPGVRLFAPANGLSNGFLLDPALPRDGGGNVLVSHDFPAPRTFAEGDAFAVDFDLANFLIRGGNIIPSVREGDREGLRRPDRQIPQALRGVVRDLTGDAPNRTFVLTRRNGLAVTVTTSEATAVSGDLTNGATVEVTGRYDAETRRLVAEAVEVVPGDAPDFPRQPEMSGEASEIDAEAGTFLLTPREVNGVSPVHRRVRVRVAGETTYRGPDGRERTRRAFFELLREARRVRVKGTYNPTANELTAIRARILRETGR
jgi:hypothetical protein